LLNEQSGIPARTYVAITFQKIPSGHLRQTGKEDLTEVFLLQRVKSFSHPKRLKISPQQSLVEERNQPGPQLFPFPHSICLTTTQEESGLQMPYFIKLPKDRDANSTMFTLILAQSERKASSPIVPCHLCAHQCSLGLQNGGQLNIPGLPFQHRIWLEE
jgi:hypothetical protein